VESVRSAAASWQGTLGSTKDSMSDALPGVGCPLPPALPEAPVALAVVPRAMQRQGVRVASKHFGRSRMALALLVKEPHGVAQRATAVLRLGHRVAGCRRRARSIPEGGI
jgi:hypothetical protein